MYHQWIIMKCINQFDMLIVGYHSRWPEFQIVDDGPDDDAFPKWFLPCNGIDRFLCEINFVFPPPDICQPHQPVAVSFISSSSSPPPPPSKGVIAAWQTFFHENYAYLKHSVCFIFVAERKWNCSNSKSNCIEVKMGCSLQYLHIARIPPVQWKLNGIRKLYKCTASENK